jgi:ligand-binding SRPBCC domain-containing protein
MPTRFRFEQWVPFPPEQVFLFFAQPENLPRIMPPKLHTRIENLKLISPVIPSEAGTSAARSSVVEGTCVSLAGVGSEITTSFKVLPYLPLRSTWVAQITEFEWNHHFADIQKLGPFHSFHHRHELQSETHNGVIGTKVTDTIDLDLSCGWIGKTIEKLFIAGEMKRTFRYRQQALLTLLSGSPALPARPSRRPAPR